MPDKNLTPSYVWVSQHWVEMTTQHGVFMVFHGWLDIHPSIARYNEGRFRVYYPRKQDSAS